LNAGKTDALVFAARMQQECRLRRGNENMKQETDRAKAQKTRPYYDLSEAASVCSLEILQIR